MRHGTANGGVKSPERPADPSIRDCKRGCCWSPYGHSTVRDQHPRWHRDACHCHDTPKGHQMTDPNTPAPAVEIGARYRKKPVEITAAHFTDPAAGGRIAAWSGGSNERSPHEIQIETPEGTMTASLGDYVIRGVAGEFYPCKPEIFDATYEAVE